MEMVGVDGDCRKEEGKEVLPAGEGMEPVEVFYGQCTDSLPLTYFRTSI